MPGYASCHLARQPADWSLLEFALRERLPPTPLTSSHTVVLMLLPAERRKSILMQYLADRPLAIESSLDVPAELYRDCSGRQLRRRRASHESLPLPGKESGDYRSEVLGW